MGKLDFCRDESFQTQKINKKLLSISLIFVTIIILLAAIWLNTPQTYAIQSGSSHIVIDAESGRVLSSYNKDMRLEMASTTKIATAIVAIENATPDTVVEITDDMVAIEGSSIYLKVGEKWKLEDLLYGLMLQSGNDAATAIAISVGGSMDRFVDMMNNFAIKLGLENTNFDNPHGLHSENHYTSAHDLACITAYALKNPLFAKIVSSKSHFVEGNDCLESRTFYNKNKLLSSFSGANGVKTGYTTDSGRCFVGAAERNGMQLVSVVINCPDMWNKTKSLLSEAFNDYIYYKIGDSSENLEDFSIGGENIELRLEKDMYYPIKRGERENFTYKFEPLERYPEYLKAGDAVGTLNVYDDNRLIFTRKIITINEIKHKGALLSLMNLVGDWQIDSSNGEIEQIFGVVRSGVAPRCG